MPRRCGSTSAVSSPRSIAAIASATVAPAASSSRLSSMRRGSASTTSTVISAIFALRLAAEVLDHPRRQTLEAELDRRGTQAHIVEIQREGDLAAVLAQRDELPHTIEAAERPFHQLHVQAPGRFGRVAGGEALPQPGELQVQPRHQHLALALEHLRAGT